MCLNHPLCVSILQEGTSALYFSCTFGYLEVVGLLLKLEAVVDIATNVSSISLNGDITGCECAWIMSMAYIGEPGDEARLVVS